MEKQEQIAARNELNMAFATAYMNEIVLGVVASISKTAIRIASKHGITEDELRRMANEAYGYPLSFNECEGCKFCEQILTLSPASHIPALFICRADICEKLSGDAKDVGYQNMKEVVTEQLLTAMSIKMKGDSNGQKTDASPT